MEPLGHPDGGVEGEALNVPQACPEVLREQDSPEELCRRRRDVALQTLQQTRPTAQHTTPTFVDTGNLEPQASRLQGSSSRPRPLANWFSPRLQDRVTSCGTASIPTAR